MSNEEKIERSIRFLEEMRNRIEFSSNQGCIQEIINTIKALDNKWHYVLEEGLPKEEGVYVVVKYISKAKGTKMYFYEFCDFRSGIFTRQNLIDNSEAFNDDGTKAELYAYIKIPDCKVLR